jgi:Serine dehydrogenase proteinase
MTVLDIFWIFFMLSALQPVIRQRMLDAMRMRKIAQLERERSSRVILLVHRQETMKLLGFPVMRYIDVNDSEEVLRAIQIPLTTYRWTSYSTHPEASSSRRCRSPVRFAVTRQRSQCWCRITRCRAEP